VSEELRRRVFDSLNDAPDNDFSLTNITQAISLSPPDSRITGNSTMLSIFCYHLAYNPHNHNQMPLRIPPNGVRQPPMALHLHYMMTPLQSSEDLNQLMLGRILQHFHFNPVIDSIEGIPLDDSFGGANQRYIVKFTELNLNDLQTLWTMLDEPYRLCATFSVRSVAIDSDKGAVIGAPVEEMHTVVGIKDEDSS
jgi:hypothetical protein